MSSENLKGAIPKAKATLKPTIPESIPLTVKFSDEISHFGDISGGKGSSLGKLTALSIIEKSFTVPKGIVVTTSAYSEFLTTEIIAAIKKMEDVVYGNVEGDPKEACSKVSSVVEKAILPSDVCNSISKDLKELFGENLNNKFAVRSSATGEDTAAMSAAGQMDTFLGVQGLEEIYTAVKKCWASQFGFIAVEYKRRNGQVLNSPMAVVIQEMVASEVSGVLFTCDPVTNNPSFITITANYGLGETVVSGSVEPDTIMLKRHSNGKLELDSVVVGSKLQKIVMKASGGTVTEDIPEKSRFESCLTREMSERLGNLALKIESYYKSPRDIEWGISNNSIFMLQSRPVTNIAAETEYEIKHEFDAGIRCEIEYFTKANIGEVMPRASSPLGSDMVAKFLRVVLKKHAAKMGFADNTMNSMYFLTGMMSFYNHWMATIEMITRCGFDTPIGRGLMISLYGRILDDPDMLSFVREKLSACTAPAPKPTLTTALQYYKSMYLQQSGNEENKRRSFNYHCNFLKHGKAQDTFRALLDSCNDFDDIAIHHEGVSEASSNWNMNLFTILSDAHGALDTDVYSDFAKLLATSKQVESANVPQALQETASQIVKDIDAAKFKSMPVEEAVKWLESTTSPSGDKFRQFIKRHGHRCLKEADIYSMTWEMDPKSLVKMLQTLVGTGGDDEKKAEAVDFEKLVSGLNVRLGTIHRLKLKHALPHCREGIRNREIGKACIVKCIDYWRQGFRRLAKQMVAEGRLPEEDLLFFMQLDEIKHLLETRSPGIISRANYRKKLFPIVDTYIFPEISRGLPKPINAETDSVEDYEYVADLTMKGTPVSQGVTKGYARVAMNIDEASYLKKGEILITYSTDIGWSPYFPIVSGVVTELGGLISHGAVVSREYGLPCVVGLQGATKKFQTGDYVLLDGKKGILQRLPKPEE